MKKYIHYGAKKFDRVLCMPIHNIRMFTKPSGGFWASKIDAEFGWKEWCEDNDYFDCDEENSFIFELAENARILEINSVEDLKKLPGRNRDIGFLGGFYTMLDFEKLAEQYDAIEVSISSDYRLYRALTGWDCDSILIMNPDIVRSA